MYAHVGEAHKGTEVISVIFCCQGAIRYGVLERAKTHQTKNRRHVGAKVPDCDRDQSEDISLAEFRSFAEAGRLGSSTRSIRVLFFFFFSLFFLFRMIDKCECRQSREGSLAHAPWASKNECLTYPIDQIERNAHEQAHQRSHPRQITRVQKVFVIYVESDTQRPPSSDEYHNLYVLSQLT